MTRNSTITWYTPSTGTATPVRPLKNTTIPWTCFITNSPFPPSDHFKDLYKSIRSKEQGINTNLDSIQETLKEDASGGAFYCEYPVFHDLFQLERRAIERTGDSIYLCLLTIGDLDGHAPRTTVLNKAMEHLNHAIRDSLRCSDVYTRYSISQYIILLPTVAMEKGEMVMKRDTGATSAGSTAART